MFRQCPHDREQTPLRLTFHHLIFRTGAGVDSPVFGARIALRIEIAPSLVSAFQSLIVRNPEQPATQIVSRLAAPKMLEERKKYVLQDLFTIGKSKAKAGEVT